MIQQVEGVKITTSRKNKMKINLIRCKTLAEQQHPRAKRK